MESCSEDAGGGTGREAGPAEQERDGAEQAGERTPKKRATGRRRDRKKRGRICAGAIPGEECPAAKFLPVRMNGSRNRLRCRECWERHNRWMRERRLEKKGPRCACGVRMAPHSACCRRCWEAGRGRPLPAVACAGPGGGRECPKGVELTAYRGRRVFCAECGPKHRKRVQAAAKRIRKKEQAHACAKCGTLIQKRSVHCRICGPSVTKKKPPKLCRRCGCVIARKSEHCRECARLDRMRRNRAARSARAAARARRDAAAEAAGAGEAAAGREAAAGAAGAPA